MLKIRNWDKFQHYSDGRRLVWVKLFVEQLDDEKLHGLSLAAQLLFDRLLLVAAVNGNRIPEDSAWIGDRVGIPTRLIAGAVEELRGAKLLCA